MVAVAVNVNGPTVRCDKFESKYSAVWTVTCNAEGAADIQCIGGVKDNQRNENSWFIADNNTVNLFFYGFVVFLLGLVAIFVCVILACLYFRRKRR
jgi:hypothetical protein